MNLVQARVVVPPLEQRDVWRTWELGFEGVSHEWEVACHDLALEREGRRGDDDPLVCGY